MTLLGEFNDTPESDEKEAARKIIREVIVGSYADYFSHWYGLPDGTMLELNDARGQFWVKVGGQLMTVEEFNRSQREND